LQIGGHQTVGLQLAQQGVHRAVRDVNVLGEIVGYLVAVAVLPALGTLRYSELRWEMGNITDAVLVSMGGAPKASILLGKGENERAEKVMGSCTWVLLLLSALLTGVMLAFGRPILLIFGARAEGCAWDLKNVRGRIPYAVGAK
jgi:hypothetical protein